MRAGSDAETVANLVIRVLQRVDSSIFVSKWLPWLLWSDMQGLPHAETIHPFPMPCCATSLHRPMSQVTRHTWAATDPYLLPPLSVSLRTSLPTFQPSNLLTFQNPKMSPAKPNLKAVMQAVSKTRLVNVPGLTKPPNYRCWLDTLFHTPQNRKVLETAEKAKIDDVVRLLADQQFKNDSKSLKMVLEQVICTARLKEKHSNTWDRRIPRLVSTHGLTQNFASLGVILLRPRTNWWQAGHRLKKQ